MSMCIEVEARTIYTVHLTDEDIEKVKKWIKEHKEDLPSFKMEDNIAWAIARLYEDDEISLYETTHVIFIFLPASVASFKSKDKPATPDTSLVITLE